MHALQRVLAFNGYCIELDQVDCDAAVCRVQRVTVLVYEWWLAANSNETALLSAVECE